MTLKHGEALRCDNELKPTYMEKKILIICVVIIACAIPITIIGLYFGKVISPFFGSLPQFRIILFAAGLSGILIGVMTFGCMMLICYRSMQRGMDTEWDDIYGEGKGLQGTGGNKKDSSSDIKHIHGKDFVMR